LSKTIENLSKALAGESQARNRYTFYAKIAKEEGLEKVAEAFLLSAENEKEHAKWLLRLINQLKSQNPEISDETVIESSVPNVLADTKTNLKAAIAGENYEHTIMYPQFAQVAEEEGLTDIAKRLRSIAKAEQHHEERYKKILSQLEAGTFFKKEKEVQWVCRECGYVHLGTQPPQKCPSCDHDQAYYELKCECF